MTERMDKRQTLLDRLERLRKQHPPVQEAYANLCEGLAQPAPDNALFWLKGDLDAALEEAQVGPREAREMTRALMTPAGKSADR